MTRRRIVLLRHGDVSYITDGGERPPSDLVPLNERGREQARAAGEVLRETAFDLVVTSALRRTLETAELVLGGRVLPHRVVADLNEIAPGDVATLGSHEAMRHAVTNAFVDAALPDARFLAGERFDVFEERVLRAFDALLADASYTTALVVAHGGVNRAILARALGGGRASYGSIEQDPACINVLDVDPSPADGSHRRTIVRLMNFTPYEPVKRGIHRTTMESLWAKFAGE